MDLKDFSEAGIIGIVIIQIVWTNSVKELDPYSNNKECPDCRCPFARDMIESQNFVDKVVTETGETITEKTTTYSDGTKSVSTEKNPYSRNIYHGHSYEIYYCFSDDDEKRFDYTNKWGSEPELDKKVYPKDKDKLAAQQVNG